jgi:diaminopimelate decarboxylase
MFLDPVEAAEVRKRFGTPCYVYDRATLEAAARSALAFPRAFGVTVRYAMKANSCRAVLEIFRDLDLRIDASSDFEVERALRAGFAAERIALTSQAPSRRLRSFVEGGIRFTACSLVQLERFGEAFPGRDVTIRVNPGLGSGATNRVNTGGPASSFGIWYEELDRAKDLAARYGVAIAGLHTHIGSGSDPAVWTRVARMALEIAERLPDVIVVSLGGGFKVARVPGEHGSDLHAVGSVVREEFLAFKARTGRLLDVEIEPGTYLTANAGAIVATCIDVVSTGRQGYTFAKLDAGMTELLRPSLYGAQHPIEVMAGDGTEGASQRARAAVVFVGPCCETGDVLTPASGDPEGLAARDVPSPEVGDVVVIGGAGAYGAAMAAAGYNSYPMAPEVMRDAPGDFRLARRRQTLEQLLANEVAPE